jgi:hypothetical protein
VKPWIRDDEVRRRIPRGFNLPPAFDSFIRAEPPYEIEWCGLERYDLKPSAEREAVPFMKMPDGGLVAFWYCAPSPAVVHIGGHGELKVLASNFDDFLKAIALRQSGLPDIDESEDVFRVPGVNGEPSVDTLPALQKRFDEWFKIHTSLLVPLTTPEAEAFRQRVYRIAEEMVRDGMSKVYTLESPCWRISYRIQRNGPEIAVTYLDYGKWYPLPSKYRFLDEVPALLQLVRDKTRSQYELEVMEPGIVSVDRDRELSLVPPDFEIDQ